MDSIIVTKERGGQTQRRKTPLITTFKSPGLKNHEIGKESR
ncbi:hypothetical protein CCACVL1_30000 [Corchorus capsularis]|uniref:Uncharacterized protein n=1 Tax=Corchorus capsularis TaxID=210143 RepID=A0A1R3FZ57_COCAP|nr:hypothetical protein CCACVL1_30000 [Corchorus capsularis]